MPVAKMGKSDLFSEGGAIRKHFDEVVKPALEKSTQFSSLAGGWQRLQLLRDNSWAYECSDDLGLVTKDMTKAMELKDKGNELFKANQLMEAKEMYTQALQHCPFDESDPSKNQEYSVILANRSAVTDKVYLYSAALQDVDLALKYNYPKQLLFKIYNRRGHSLLKLKRYADSKEAFKKCTDWIGKSDMNQVMRDKWRAKLKKQMGVFGVVKQVKNEDDEASPLTRLTKDTVDKMVPGTAEVEAESIDGEQVVFCEKPLAMVLNDDAAEGKICPVELTVMPAPVQCTLGSTTLFSSEAARQRANGSFHKYEYKVVEPIKRAGLTPKAKLALRVVTTLDPKNIPDVLGKAAPEDPNAKATWKLVSLPMATLDQGSEMEVALLTSYLMSCLDKAGYKNDKVTPEMLANFVDKAVRAVLAHSQMILYSQGSFDKSQLWSVSEIPLKKFAIGVYPEYNTKLANSKPQEVANVLSFFHRGALFLQSVRRLTKGQVVNLHTSAAQASAISFPANMINHSCSGKDCSLSFPLDKAADNPITCPLEDCGIQTNIWKRLKRIQELRRDHEAARRDIEFNEDGKKGIEMLKGIIRELETMVNRPDGFLTTLDEDYAKTLVLKHIESERKWLDEHK